MPLRRITAIAAEWKAEGYTDAVLEKVFYNNAAAFLSGVEL